MACDTILLGLTVSGALVTTVDGSMAMLRLDSIVLRLSGIAVMRLDSIALRLSGMAVMRLGGIAVMVATLRLSNSCQATTGGLCETSMSFMEFGRAGIASSKALAEA